MSAADVVEAIQRETPNGKGWVRANCPRCPTRAGKVDRVRSLGYQVQTGWFHCFRCGAKGWIKGNRPEYSGAHFDDEPIEPVKEPDGFYRIAEEPGCSSMVGQCAIRYLEGRGVGLDAARDANIGVCACGKFANRVIIPILSDDREWVWFVGRALAKNDAKRYMYPSGARNGIMFNHSALFVKTDEPVIAVEGCFDALPYRPDGVAVLGKPTEAHIEAFKLARRPVCVVLDGDAWQEGEMLALRLRFEGVRAGALRLPPKTDPDEVDPDELRELARQSLDA